MWENILLIIALSSLDLLSFDIVCPVFSRQSYMAVCQYFIRGTCRFGDSCRNEHPADARQSGFGNSGWGNQASTSNDKGPLPFNAGTIGNDLNPATDKPLWPLSSYGPAKHEPLLISGLDESPEELRVKAVTSLKNGTINEYLQYESTQIATANEAHTNARSNSTQAFEQAAKQSRIPSLLAAASGSTPSAFGTNTTSAFPSTSSAFGSTSTPSAFGGGSSTSAFGSTSTPSAFGALSTYGSTPSAFGQPAFGQASLGQTSTSAFGQPQTTSAFGQPAQATTSAFGQPSTNTTATSVFGQPSFGQPSGAATTSTFGQPSGTTASVFGQPTQPAATTSAFGQPSAFGQAAQGSSSFIKPASGAFGSTSATPSVFGGGSTTAGSSGGGFSAFANQPSAFGITATNTQSGGSVFGQPSFGQPTAPSAFGTPSTTAPTAAPSAFSAQSAFGGTTSQPVTSAFGNTSNPTPAPSAFGPTNITTSAFGQSAFEHTNNPSGSIFGPQSAFGNPISAPGISPALSVSMATPTATSSPFGSTFGAQQAFATPTAPKPTAASHAALDFTEILSIQPGGEKPLRFAFYQPGMTPYDSQLPQGYLDMLPKVAADAFKAQRFEWGKVPDWVPPLELR